MYKRQGKQAARPGGPNIEADTANLQALEDRVTALEDKLDKLDQDMQEKAPLFVAVPPLYLKTDVALQQLYSEEVPAPSAIAVRLDGKGGLHRV